MDKAELRKIAARRIKELESRAEESRLISDRLFSLPEFIGAETILSYRPLPSEPDIRIEGRDVLYPFILEDGIMEFGRGLGGTGRYGIQEPERIAVPYSTALMIVPLLGYSAGLRRLGRGGGYYDRYICRNRDRLITAGVAFSCSLLDNFIPESHDAALDMIITPFSVLRSPGR